MDAIELPAEVTDAALFAIVVGFLQPVVLDLLIQTRWSKLWKALAAFLFSTVTGGLTAYFAGAFTGLGVVTTILLVAVVSISAYKGFWSQVAPKLGTSTDVAPKHRA